MAKKKAAATKAGAGKKPCEGCGKFVGVRSKVCGFCKKPFPPSETTTSTKTRATKGKGFLDQLKAERDSLKATIDSIEAVKKRLAAVETLITSYE